MASSSILLTLIITFMISLSSSLSMISSPTTNTIPSSPTTSPFEQHISPEIAPLFPSPAVSSTTQTIPSSSSLPQPENDDVLTDPDPAAFAPSASPPVSSQAPQVLLSVVFATASCFSLRLLAVSAL
ncbi:hypothetical protein CARUB_v10014924mg [Capsella rubella]|uniref:Uncharacterized protein n=1 Tax=Capsella rubella TaxID=81985 RepID=R0G881_9BRAS|nr:classical arabinogalactan protein 27 [Capsella rubella]EOA31716.1 hypothetical protein CARUB_v10014924mg [Capsella rubella]